MIDWSIAAVAGKAVVYATCLVAGGGVLFLSMFASRLNQAEHRYVTRLVRAMAVVGVLAAIARVMTLSGMLGGDLPSALDATLIRIVLESSEGPAALVRLAGLLAIALFAFGIGAFGQALSLTGALAAVGSFALTGHTSSLEPSALPKLLITAHLIAVAYWIGALLPLMRLTASLDHARVAEILKRFGNVALVTVGILIAAGALLAWLLTGSIQGFLEGTYGRLVLLKVSLVAVLLSLAALNKLSLTPSVAAGAPGAMTSLRRSITAELLLAVAILTVTASFTTITGPPVLE